MGLHHTIKRKLFKWKDISIKNNVSREIETKGWPQVGFEGNPLPYSTESGLQRFNLLTSIKVIRSGGSND